DVVARKLIPWPSLFGADGRLMQEDIANRRRVWFWRGKYRLAALFALIIVTIWIVRIINPNYNDSFSSALGAFWDGLVAAIEATPTLFFTLGIFFLINLVILFGPLMFFSIKQIQGFEPGDADWGVRLEDVRGQEEPKEEVSRVVTLWQSGEEFERAGGKRER